jgi:c-di-GMP-binding flagellar brake protein YcgR
MGDNSYEDRRVYRRAKLDGHVRFQLKDPKAFGGCLSCDISEGGMRMVFTDFIPLGTELLINANLATQKMIECLGKVVWVRKFPFMDRYEAGLEFCDFGSLYDSRNEIYRHVQA